MPSRRASPGDPSPAAVPTVAVAVHPTGAVINLAVTPRAATTAIDALGPEAVRPRVSAPPVDGAANAAVLTCLGDALAVPRSALRLLIGATGRRKRVLVTGLTPPEVLDRLSARAGHRQRQGSDGSAAEQPS